MNRSALSRFAVWLLYVYDIYVFVCLLTFPVNKYEWMLNDPVTSDLSLLDNNAGDRALFLGVLVFVSIIAHVIAARRTRNYAPLAICGGLLAGWLAKFVF